MTDLSPRQAAERLGVSRSLIYREIERGNLHAYQVGGRLRIEATELDAFRERNRVAPRRGPLYEPARPPRRLAEGDTFASDLRAIRGGRA